MKTFEGSYIFKFLPELIKYLPITLEIWILSLILSIILGSLAAAIRIRKTPILYPIVRIFISYVRGTPVIAQLFLVYFGLRSVLKGFGIDISSDYRMVFVVATYGLNLGAGVSENLRSSLLSVGKGQLEACYTVGMTEIQAFCRVILPQALVVALPNFMNLSVAALKSTSLAFSVGVVELLSRGKMLGGTSLHFLESYVALAIIYYVLYVIIIWGYKFIDKRFVGKYKKVVA